MKKFIIPTYIEYNACQLTIGNLDDFKRFILRNAYDIKITYKEIEDKDIPVEINFKWNPCGNDYPPTIYIQLNQYFLYEKDAPDNYLILNSEDISRDWYIHES